jgi:hypothetical protein
MRSLILIIFLIFQSSYSQTNTTENSILLPIINVEDYKLETGIYYLKNGLEEKIFPSAIHDIRINNLLLSSLTLFLLPINSRAYLIHSTSNNKIQEQEFVFSFNGVNDDILSNNFETQWFRSASSPNEFLLVQLKSKETQRIRDFRIAKGNLFAQKNGIDPKKTISFSIDYLGNDMYKIIPNKILEKGEYCFIYQSPIENYRNQLVFDFSVE